MMQAPPLILSSRPGIETWLSPDHGVLRCEAPPDHPPSPPASSNDSSSASMSPGDTWVPPLSTTSIIRVKRLPYDMSLRSCSRRPMKRPQTSPGVLPPRCGGGRAGVDTLLLLPRAGSGPAVLPCRPNNQGGSSHRWDLPGRREEVEYLYLPGPKKDVPRQHRVAKTANSVNRRCRTDSERRRIPLTPPVTLSTLSRAGENWFNMPPPPPQGTSQTTKRLYKLSSPAFRFNPVNISPAVAKLNGIRIWKQRPYPVGEL